MTMLEHAPWCVRADHTGQCSEKRGHWDRSTNTWDSDLTEADRKVIAEALVRWREKGQPIGEVGDWLRTHETFRTTSDGTLMTWWMTHRRMAKKGRSWPV